MNNELIKYGGPALCHEICKLFQKICESKIIPESWTECIIIPVFKKGDKKEPNNYRGISLLCSMSKLFTKIIAAEIAKHGMCEEQQGFRKNRSTIDAIFIMRQIVEKSLEYSKPAYLCFVDLTKAFDRVRLKDVIKLLHKKNIAKNILEIICELNKNNKAAIKVNSKLTCLIPITSGIRQGDSLSPTLFNIIMDEIIDQVKIAAPGFRMTTGEFKIISYADDAVLIAENEDDLQRLLFKFEQVAEVFNMKISTEKTKCLVVSKEPIRCKLAVHNKPIEQVLEFTYLGTRITSNKNLRIEVKQAANKAASISGCLRTAVWRNKYMRTESKVRIYKTCIRPILTYGAETRADTAVTQKDMATVEMKTLRAIAGYTMYDRKTNEEIRNICNVPEVTKWVRKRRKAWRDHVRRMSNGRLAKMALDGKVNQRRQPGRPPKRWHECWTSGSTDAQNVN